MGSWFGGLLALSGNSVQLLTTNTAHCGAINKTGLTLRQPDANVTLIQLLASAPENIVTPVDLVIVLTKTFQTDTAINSITHAINSSTNVLSLQNGLGNAEALARVVPLERIWAGVSMQPVDKIGPGAIASKGHGASYFGPAQSTDVDTDVARTGTAIESLFQAANIDLTLDFNIHKRIWEKVAFNAGMNALSALSNGTPGDIANLDEAVALAKEVALETAQVAKTQTIFVELDRVYDMIELSCTKHGEHVPSMLQDVRMNRRTEVDALNGAIADIAKRMQVPAPLNKTLATLVRLAERSYLPN